MSWLRSRRPAPEKFEGREALAREDKAAKDAAKMGTEVKRLAQSLKTLREENHFAEAITNLLRGHQP